ncbi:ATP12-domain-containing protein [Amylostereum chailletii]|nr:ATP12-domain-containing protein [Amylostereum chailletii]
MFATRLLRSLRASPCYRTTPLTLRVPYTRGYAHTPEVPPVTATNRAEATLKRFWKTVAVEKYGADGRYAVTLDRRPLKTPSGNKVLLPDNKRLVATLIASEWDNQEVLLKPHALPMTSITARAIDAMDDEATRAEVRDALLKYFDTDTICFYSERPEHLTQLQKDHWDPLIDWARSHFDIEVYTTNTIMFSPQPDATKEVLDKVMQGFDRWQMAAMERATYTTKSFLIALALVFKQVTAEQAALASQVEVSSQIKTWGEVEDSHDVDHHDVRRHLGSAACILSTL